MNRRVMLVFGAVGVLAAAVILYLALHAEDKPAASERSRPSEPVAQTETPKNPAHPSGVPTVTASETQRVADKSDDTVKEYVIDGVRIRDHRKGDHPAPDLPRNIHPPNTRQIPSSLTHELSKQIQTVMADCAASIPKEARGAKPRLEGTVFVSIKNHQVQITEAAVQLRQVEGDDVVAAAKQCIEQKSVGLGTQAADEADLDRYSISISFALPAAR